MANLAAKNWVATDAFIQSVAAEFASLDFDGQRQALFNEVLGNRRIHESECVNLNPATNVMNPVAEALLSSGLGTRPSLGSPGDKYEMGLEAIERIEVYAAELACQVFNARFAEIRVASGAMANLYAFMACCEPGDTIIAPPASIGGHVTHHGAGAAGLYRLNIVDAPVDADRYSIDIDQLESLVRRVRPRLISVGGSLNLMHHPLDEIVAIAHRHDVRVLFDAAHLSGLIAGGGWPNPLREGVDLMTMSTYKSFAGPPSGLVLTSDDELAKRLDAIAFPGLTANFDAAKAAAMVITLIDWLEFGSEYAVEMKRTCGQLSRKLVENDIPVFLGERTAGLSHQLGVDARQFGGGQAASRLLRQANLLACGIGLPIGTIAGDMNGLRLGTPECVRWGMDEADMSLIAGWLADVLLNRREIKIVRDEVTAFRRKFSTIHFAASASMSDFSQ
ncbi:MAG: serine hydroxymethyltransferase [marine bacterium B5-7]|nr:MAG: serine hydroxymethyltransferase [marine bacterium B5-7]